MGAGSSVSDALSDAAADVEVSLTEALESLRGYSAPALIAPRGAVLTRDVPRSTRAAREKGWKAIGSVSLRDAKLRVRSRRALSAAALCTARALRCARACPNRRRAARSFRRPSSSCARR